MHVLDYVKARSSLMEKIQTRQFNHEKLRVICHIVLIMDLIEAFLDFEGILRISAHVYMPMIGDLIRLILEKVHSLWYSIHPGATEMYYNLKQHH